MADKKRLLIMTGIYLIVILFFSVWYTCKLIDKSAVISFKKLYSMYSQALLTTVYEMGGDTGCYYSSKRGVPGDFSGCDRFYKNFATNLRVIKYCKNNALSQGCIPLYNKYSNTAKCAGFSENMMNRYNQAFVMNDKTSLVVFNMPANVPKPIFAVDSNGLLRPNKTGYDLFSLVIMKSPNGNYYFHPNVTYCLPVEDGKIKNIQDIYK